MSHTQQVDFINDKNGHFLDIASVLPASAHTVPLLRCGDDQISLHYSSHVWSHVPRQLHHPNKHKHDKTVAQYYSCK